jgi:hypothetical protein
MPLVRVRILLGKSVLGEPTRVFGHDVSIKDIIDQALEPFNTVKLTGSVDVFKDAEEKVRMAQLTVSDLDGITVRELILGGFGTNLVAHVENASDKKTYSTPSGASAPTPSSSSGGAPSSLPDTLQEMMGGASERPLVWPPPATGSYLNHTIFNALLDELKRLSLGWHPADAREGGSGHRLLMALSKALQYTLPFDANGAQGSSHCVCMSATAT